MSTLPALPPLPSARELFEQLLGLDAAGRSAALADAALPAALRAEVESLLVHGGAAGTGFLATPAQAPGGDGPPPELPAPSRIGQRLGAWRIVQLLGSGGMGEVFEVQRDDGRFAGRAAIKVLKRGMDSQAVLARFALEQQALARLTHPNIARLLDAGVTPDGLPYFVMERVQGRPIDRACEGLALADRLRLFLQLAAAVAHAHRNLLVHRDLKPGNVLVDAEGRVKLLDFGIAKALDPLEGAQEATGTALGGRPFTPHYASPEQVRGEPVSTATDVYSLGVLLYVMLTGARPYGRQAVTATEAARSVIEEHPTRPSQLAGELRGDLDNILLKALAKQPAARYAGVDALAADVQAHLDGRPVDARAASPGYLLAKWLLRNRAVALAAALGALGLVTGLAASLLQGRVALALGAVGLGAGLVLALVQASRAQIALDAAARARDESARHVVELRQLTQRMIFDVNDALERGLVQGRRQLMHLAAQTLQHQASFGQLSDDERLSLGHALNRLARVEGHEFANNLGNVEEALARYDEAWRVLEPLAPRQQGNADWHGAMATALDGRAACLRTLRQPDASMENLEQAARHIERAAALAPADLRWRATEVHTRNLLIDQTYSLVRAQGQVQLDRAQVHLQRALELSARFVADHPGEPRAWRMRSGTLRYAAGVEAVLGRLETALALDAEAWQMVERAIALPGGASVRDTDLVPSRIRTAITLRAAGRYEQAMAAITESLDFAIAAVRRDPLDENLRRSHLASVQTLMDLRLHRGEFEAACRAREEAEPLLPACPAGLAEVWHWNVAWMDSLHALALARTGRAGQATVQVERLLRWQQEGRLPNQGRFRALDCELEANIHIARAHALGACGDAVAAQQAAQAALERLAAMRALRDPRDAVEAIRSWQLTVRLAQGVGGDALALARVQQAALCERGLGADGRYAESAWLAAQADP